MRTVIGMALLAALQACVPVRWEEPQPTVAPATRSKPESATRRRSGRGNPTFYEVYGVRYHVLDSSDGYQERGVASWYGKKFHGRPTSSGEIYDMYEMTAAHKTLPLPTNVRVTHLGNGKSVIVSVNDRGPFVRNRIIDLSYAAARELEMIGAGTALVEVEALRVPGAPAVQAAADVPLMTGFDTDSPPAGAPRPEADDRLYLQVGAFGDPVNARQMQRRLEDRGLANVVVHYDLATSPTLYRVRLGPIADVAEYDALVELMAGMQIDETHLVTGTGAENTLDAAPALGSPAGVSVSGATPASGG